MKEGEREIEKERERERGRERERERERGRVRKKMKNSKTKKCNKGRRKKNRIWQEKMTKFSLIAKSNIIKENKSWRKYIEKVS